MNQEIFSHRDNYKKKVQLLQKLNGLDDAISHGVAKVDQLMENMGEYFPGPASVKQKYEKIENNYWTTSFYTGLLFLSYFHSNEDKYKSKIEKHIESFKIRLEKEVELETHDIGFLYEYSTMATYKYLQSEEAKIISIKAADLLMKRYHRQAGIIQAWGNLTKSSDRGRMIIDANMNLPLLYWVSQVTGNQSYYEAAYRHVKNAQTFIMREDNSTYHTYYFDPDSGVPLRGSTQQGFSDDSCWARGQAWAIYGFTLSYEYTKDESLLYSAMKAADYFITHLPKDKVCYWDLVFTDGDDQERDSSSAAIAACGLLELAEKIQEISPLKASEYLTIVYEIMSSLIMDYSTKKDDSSDGLILHSVYSKPHGKGVDECSTWGDYYYLEALLRLKGNYKKII